MQPVQQSMPPPESESERSPTEIAAWFVAANPNQYRWETAFAEGTVEWHGARSAIAQKNIRMCRPGDRVIAYQSSPEQIAIGLGEIAEPPFAATDEDGEYHAVRITMGERFVTPIPLSSIRAVAPTMRHFAEARPSFTPVTPEEWAALEALFQNPAASPAGEKSARTPTHLDELRSRPLSPLAQDILTRCAAIAQREDYRRWISSGMLLGACLEIGRERLGREFQTASWLASRIDWPAFESALARYFANHRSQRHGRQPPRPFEYVSQHCTEIVDEAARLAGTGEIGARHLIVALLSVGHTGGRAPSSWQLLYEARADRHALLRELLDNLIAGGFPPERDDWSRERRRLVKVSAIIAGFSADAPSGEDCLRLDRDVTALASLVVARSVEPPLAVGVFGPWGSGKSFFLRRLREAIARTAQSGDAHYWSNVVQIEFNAWHYVDANLWASLTAHILQQLSLRSQQAGGGAAQQAACRAALALLELADERLRQASKVEAELKLSVAVAEQKTSDAIKTIEEDERALALEVSRNLAREIDVDRVLASHPQARDAVGELAEIDVAWKGALATGADLRQRAEQLGRTGTRLELLASALLGGHGFVRHALPWLIGAGALLALGWGWLGPWLDEHVLGKAAAVLVPLGTTFAGLARWVAQQRTRIESFFEPLDRVRQTLDDQIASAEAARQSRIAELRTSLDQKRAHLQQATSEKAEAERAVADAKRAASDAVSGQAIDAFVAQRVGSGEYQKHLGLVALVRNDFEKLGSMILTHNGIQGGSHEPEIVAALRAKGVEIENLGINRIVLYIDDLDRCPSHRVVEVLQAIHLLLAFPVFVVVVAVDSRWMKRALAKEYPLLVGGLERPANGSTPGADSFALPYATPEDYLEKIFQIPYWLPAMSASDCGRLLRSLATPGAATRPEPPAARPADPALAESRANAPAPAASAAAASPPDVADVADVDDDADDDAPDGTFIEPPPTPSAERLELGIGEADAMEQLALLVGRSPRAAKRFVNTYRVIRASLSQSEVDQMPRLRSHDAILFLLALHTGAPTLAARFEALRSTSAHALTSITTLLSEAAEAVLRAPTAPSEREAIARAQQWAETADARWTSLTRQLLDEWAPRVRRFTFVGDDESLHLHHSPEPPTPA